jgi:5-methylcytosine-specific restriction endonuclease McrA
VEVTGVHDTSKFTVKDRELAEALEISLERLYEIVDFFDNDPNDPWELRENDHFIYLSKARGTRLFSQLGAFAIARYMDSIEEKTLWSRLIEFLTRHKEKLRNAFIRQKVHENCSSLTLRNNRHFLSKKETISILCTSYARLNKAFEDIKRSEQPLERYKDFDDIDGIRYYSLSGFDRLSRELADRLTTKDRREWCKAVHVVANRTFKELISAEERKKKEVDKAKRDAKKRDQNCCQITGVKPGPANSIELAVHHIFSNQHYPQLAASLDNLITLSEQVHKEFHYWNGGFDKPCTVNELINFINEQYSDHEKVESTMQRLYQVKQIFGVH